MSGVLVLGIVVSMIVVLDLLVTAFGADTRPELGCGHTILSC
jgi:hypothetical protein